MNKNETIQFLPTLGGTKTEAEAMQLNPVVLAFVGDAVHTLYVRTRLAVRTTHNTHALHRMAALELKAEAQAAAAKRVEPLLTDAEQMAYKRARNAKANTVPKHATQEDYHLATALEGLVGFLYLQGKTERLSELLAHAYLQDE